MSYTEMFGFNKNGNAYDLAEIKNSWRGGMAIWNYLYDKYIGGNFPMFGADGFKQLNAKFDKMPECEQISLLTTYDYALVKREDFQKIIDAFRKFEGDTSLKEQADIIEDALADEDCVAVGWNQTSVNGDNWTNYGGYDDEKDECIPYNINTGDKHWFLDGFKSE
jgi:hypothetical protein